MGLSDSLKEKRKQQEEKVKEKLQYFMTLVNVYIQASSASTLRIIDLRYLPELKVLKQKFKIATEERLGVAEKKYVANVMQKEYKLPQSFFDEIDNAIKKNCKKVDDLPRFGGIFQSFLNDGMTAVTMDMQVGMRLPLIFRKWMKKMMKDSVHKIASGESMSSTELTQMAARVRGGMDKLKLSEDWLTEICYVYIILARGSKVK